MNQVDYRHYFKGRVWKNEGSQKVQEVGMYLNSDKMYSSPKLIAKSKKKKSNLYS